MSELSRLSLVAPLDFPAKDPIGFAGSTNLYEYALNRPTSLIDREGLWPDDGEVRLTRLNPPRDLIELATRVRDKAIEDANPSPLEDGYDNAWTHALGGECIRKRFGRPMASCMNIGIEFGLLSDSRVSRAPSQHNPRPRVVA